MNSNSHRAIRIIIGINSVMVLLLAGGLLIYPSLRAIVNLQDAALRGPGVSKATWRLMRNLSPRYYEWAQKRVALGRAEKLSTRDISGTEWPLFGSVFYLWAMENLQNAWQAGDHTAGMEPKVYCKDAIIAASELVIDPHHAAWVQKHWGTNYLHHENVFYRMLLIAALTSREKLLHEGAHLDLLRDQIETFSAELDRAPSGLLNDYPGECYPGDVMAAIACIRSADTVLGTDHSEFCHRSLRGFTGSNSTRLSLPPYQAIAGTGEPCSEARGCANSYLSLTAPGIWPDEAKTWFALYEKHFWQERFGIAGFREFPRDIPKMNWLVDVDAGPVIAGFGVAANAFGVGAARKAGRFDLAYPLSTEMLATVWEMPDGTLGVPRLLSNLSDAPLLGEASILWLLSIQPEKGFPVKLGGGIPAYTYVVIFGALAFGIWRMVAALFAFRKALRNPTPLVRAPTIQISIWACLMIGAVASWFAGVGLLWLAFLLAALLFPEGKERKSRARKDKADPKAAEAK